MLSYIFIYLYVYDHMLSYIIQYYPILAFFDGILYYPTFSHTPLYYPALPTPESDIQTGCVRPLVRSDPWVIIEECKVCNFSIRFHPELSF